MSISLQFLADHNFNEHILRGVLRRLPHFDLVRAREVALAEISDPKLLEWAAQHNRLLLTHDVETMIDFASDRVSRNDRMPGLVVIHQDLPVSTAIDSITLLSECSLEGEWEGRIVFLPL